MPKFQKQNYAVADAARASGKTGAISLEDAYIWSSPSLQMHFTLNAFQAQYGLDVNSVYHFRELVDASAKSVPSPNTDLLYSLVSVNATDVPQLVHIVDTGSRYQVNQITDLRSYNPRALVNKPGTYMLTARPGDFETPEGVELIELESDYALIITRTEVSGDEDLPEVHKIQDQFKIEPLTPTANNTHKFDGPSNDAHWVERMKWVLDHMPNLDPADKEMIAFIGALEASDETKKAGDAAREKLLKLGEGILDTKGMYGTRASITVGDDIRAASNLYQHLALENERAAYPRVGHDAKGERLKGDGEYKMVMPASTPLKDAGFWSITVYDEETKQMVPNPDKLYRVGDNSATKDQDGNVTINFGGEKGDKENWLPLPENGREWYLLVRLYEGEAPVVDGSWKVPPVERIS